MERLLLRGSRFQREGVPLKGCRASVGSRALGLGV